MKRITTANIGNIEYIVVRDKFNTDKELYATIPVSEIDEEGKIKRVLNGFDMCVADTLARALDRRVWCQKLAELRKQYPNDDDYLREVAKIFYED